MPAEVGGAAGSRPNALANTMHSGADVQQWLQGVLDSKTYKIDTGLSSFVAPRVTTAAHTEGTIFAEGVACLRQLLLS